MIEGSVDSIDGPDFLMEIEAEIYSRSADYAQAHGIPERGLATRTNEFGERFVLELATRAQAKHAQHIGKELDRARTRDQLELIPTEKLLQQQRAKERADRVREIARMQEAAPRAIEAQTREEQARQRQAAIEATEREIKAMIRDAPDDVVKTLALSSPTAAEAATRGSREGRRPPGHSRRTGGDAGAASERDAILRATGLT
ncbi:hypothetical protein [Nocardia heshunensis]